MGVPRGMGVARGMGVPRLEDRLDSLSLCLEEGGMFSDFP